MQRSGEVESIERRMERERDAPENRYERDPAREGSMSPPSSSSTCMPWQDVRMERIELAALLRVQVHAPG